MQPCLEANILTTLPNDCVKIIFQKLDNTTDRNAFGLTCRQWLQIQNLSRRSLIFQFFYDPKVYRTYARYLPRLLTRFPHLSSISLAFFTELPDSSLSLLSDLGETLRSLSLYCCLGITDNGLYIVSSTCPLLVSITLYRCNITDIGLEHLARSCQGLENMNLSYCMLISDCGISALSRGCTRLHALMISCCRGITGIGFRGCPPSFAYLEADSCLFTPDGLFEIVSGGGLKYLNLCSLKSWLGPDGFDRIGCGLATSLKFLNLRMCRFISDDSVAAIAKGCPSLEEWSLALCHKVRVLGWEAIGTYCKKLKILHANRCQNLCDQGLHALQNGCSQLQVLYMHGCRQISSLGLETFKLHRQDVELRAEEYVSIGPCIDELFV